MKDLGKRKIAAIQRKACSACDSTHLQDVLEMPGFPLTGIFVKPENAKNFPIFDQSLMRCADCGHGQLLNTVDPDFLYQETYTHRSSQSPISRQGNDFFLKFLNDIASDNPFKAIVEIGCNDTYLLKKLDGRAEFLFGFDPIWKDTAIPRDGKLQVLGKYIEEIEPETDLSCRPDLVISVHTLEHVNEPLKSLKPIFEFAQEGALFFVEVPGFDSLVRVARFDQVFHQHLNYFSLASFRRMIEELGGEYVSHRFNYGYWQGTMLIAFRKPHRGKRPSSDHLPKAPGEKEIQSQFSLFQAQLAALGKSVGHASDRGTTISGFGAAQMVPTLAYHMKSDLGFLKYIYDDNPEKDGLFYPGLSVRIRSRYTESELREGMVMITAVDSARPLLQKLMAIGVRDLLVPFHLF